MFELDQIREVRKAPLREIAQYVERCGAEGRPARLIFICTHNSRRSQMAQIWAQTAAAHYGLSGVETFSGGTEATAFEPRAVAAMERAGFEIRKATEGPNPVYEVRYGETGAVTEAFSKVYSDAPNPASDFCAVMTCAEADESCPVIRGATLRVSLPYEDPKASDGTAEEAAAYDARCRQIGREIFYLFYLIK